MTRRKKAEKLLQAHALLSEVYQASLPDGTSVHDIHSACWATLHSARKIDPEQVKVEMQRRREARGA